MVVYKSRIAGGQVSFSLSLFSSFFLSPFFLSPFFLSPFFLSPFSSPDDVATCHRLHLGYFIHKGCNLILACIRQLELSYLLDRTRVATVRSNVHFRERARVHQRIHLELVGADRSGRGCRLEIDLWSFQGSRH